MKTTNTPGITRVHDLIERGDFYNAALAIIELDLHKTLHGNNADTADQLKVYLEAFEDGVKRNVANWPS